MSVNARDNGSREIGVTSIPQKVVSGNKAQAAMSRGDPDKEHKAGIL